MASTSYIRDVSQILSIIDETDDETQNELESDIDDDLVIPEGESSSESDEVKMLNVPVIWWRSGEITRLPCESSRVKISSEP